MRRREFIAGLGAAAWPAMGRAQRTAAPVIGYLDPTSLDAAGALVTAFHQGLAEVGYIVGRNGGKTRVDRLAAPALLVLAALAIPDNACRISQGLVGRQLCLAG